MRIPRDAIIASEKLNGYLLRFLNKGGKSKWLESAGFSAEKLHELELAIRQATASAEAVFDRQNQFGRFYKIRGQLTGLTGSPLSVVLIWLERTDGVYTFITLYPDKER